MVEAGSDIATRIVVDAYGLLIHDRHKEFFMFLKEKCLDKKQ